jgi:hypothetical protein
MEIGTNSYGTVAEVAALTSRYTTSGEYKDAAVGPPAVTATRPTLAQVEKWIDNCSATLNVILAREGFAIPIVQADAKAACAQIVVEATVDLCHAANSAGRFYTERALERGVAPMKVIRQEMADWVEDNAAGLENLGATRTTSLLGGLAYRDSDDNGDETFPIFQRDGFHNTFTDWDGG